MSLSQGQKSLIMTSLASSSMDRLPSALNRVLLTGRGGAALASASTVAAMLSSGDLSGGATSVENDTGVFGLTNEAKSVLFMALAMAFHYLGYSFARPTTLALFTSATTGYGGSTAAFPLAMAFVSPMALLLLVGYGKVLNFYGPRGALVRTTAFCATVLCSAASLIVFAQESQMELFSIPLVKFIVGPLFVFRESYVALLTSQYWSFIASVLTPSQSAIWFAPISGLTSITSAVAGLGVATLVEKVGLPGTLIGTGTMLMLSLVAANSAYAIAERHGFNPADEHGKKKSAAKRGKKRQGDDPDANMFAKASVLFKRVPQLGALFLEILSSQGLATLLNVCFVTKLSSSIPDDAERAGWMGKFFALINVISMTLQFTVLPPLMTVIEPRTLWRALPLIIICCTSFQSFQKDPSLAIVSGSLLMMKTLEYSARRMLDEMVYVPLDFESRYGEFLLYCFT